MTSIYDMFAVYRERDLANNCWRVSKCVGINSTSISNILDDLRDNRCIVIKAIDELAAYKRGLEEE